ncbi:MAG: serB, partial [Modestobacter sp.]|nr:serB [Modestobacter sp.]
MACRSGPAPARQPAKFRDAGTESSIDMHTVRDNALAFVAGRSVQEIREASE